jgi:signal transduction histidine kinase
MEITEPLDLTDDEANLLDMHSVLNVMNLIMLELMEVSKKLGNDSAIYALLDNTAEAAESLCDPEAAQRHMENIDFFITTVQSTIDTASTNRSPEEQAAISINRDNLDSIFSVVRIRAAELVSRKATPGEWIPFDVHELRRNFNQFLSAVEKNSKGRYRIVNNVAQHEEGDYLVNFDISTSCGNPFHMPAIFQDVMRDLLANARKYTPPGGSINGGLFCDGEALRYVVIDTGRGIPSGELGSVVRFGHRAQNALDHPTRGGGFGLTKAWYVTQRHGGRMWIESGTAEESPDGRSGTRVEIRIPIPKPYRPTPSSSG